MANRKSFINVSNDHQLISYAKNRQTMAKALPLSGHTPLSEQGGVVRCMLVACPLVVMGYKLNLRPQ